MLTSLAQFFFRAYLLLFARKIIYFVRLLTIADINHRDERANNLGDASTCRSCVVVRSRPLGLATTGSQKLASKGSPQNRKAGRLVDLTLAAVEADVDHAVDVWQSELKRRCVMVIPGLAVVNKCCHHLSSNRGVLVLVP